MNRHATCGADAHAIHIVTLERRQVERRTKSHANAADTGRDHRHIDTDMQRRPRYGCQRCRTRRFESCRNSIVDHGTKPRAHRVVIQRPEHRLAHQPASTRFRGHARQRPVITRDLQRTQHHITHHIQRRRRGRALDRRQHRCIAAQQALQHTHRIRTQPAAECIDTWGNPRRSNRHHFTDLRDRVRRAHRCRTTRAVRHHRHRRRARLQHSHETFGHLRDCVVIRPSRARRSRRRQHHEPVTCAGDRDRTRSSCTRRIHRATRRSVGAPHLFASDMYDRRRHGREDLSGQQSTRARTQHVVVRRVGARHLRHTTRHRRRYHQHTVGVDDACDQLFEAQAE